MLKHLISTELKQQQKISPQMYQSLQILQMNNLQLDEYIKDAVLENPALDHLESEPTGHQSLDSMRQPVAWSWEEGLGWREDDGHARELAAPDVGESLREHLTSQFNPDLDREELRLLDAVIDYVGESGYLTASNEEISAMTGFSAEYVGYAVAYLQRLDPLGVCARNLEECLCIQLDLMDYPEPELRVMVREHLSDIASGRYNKIARSIGIPPQKVKRHCGVIKSLHPKPGANFGGEPVAMSTPDIMVSTETGKPLASILRPRSDKVRVNSYYERLAKQDEYGEAAEYLEEKLNHARWLIKAVEGRESTLKLISNVIAERQKAFFTGGEIQPLTLGEVAVQLELNESTISRAINGKFLQCSRGTYPLKYFFSIGVGSADGSETASREAVKNRIREMIAQEDKRAPLSDSRLAQMLAEEGLALSRRVIAKYRGELCIPTSSARKAD